MLMTAAETVPEYLSVRQTERGASLGISRTDYRLLAVTALSIIQPFENSLMEIYQRQSQIVALDIWIQDVCLTISINTGNGTRRLFTTGLDSPEPPVLLFAGTSSPEDWRRLKDCLLSQ